MGENNPSSAHPDQTLRPQHNHPQTPRGINCLAKNRPKLGGPQNKTLKPSDTTSPEYPQNLRYHKSSETTSPQNPQTLRNHKPSETTSSQKSQVPRTQKPLETTTSQNPSLQKSQERDGQGHQLSNPSKKEIPILAVLIC